MADRADLIYHETQTAALCGVHALNCLLQAPHFSEVELAQIAQELDAAEHALMASGGLDSADYLQYVAEGSGNVAENGMFSIQVLARALEVFGLQAVPLTSPDAAAARADPTTQEAFICNLEEHWFTVRCIHGQWWNLNSIYGSPEPLSAFHLAAYLGSLQDEGYTIFVITGSLPASQPPAEDAERVVPGQAGRWFTPEEARAATKEREKLKREGYVKATAEGVAGKAAGGQGSWMVLRRPGAKRSLEDGGEEDQLGDDPELAQALAASLADGSGRAQGRSAWGGSHAAPGMAAGHDDEDADLAAAIAASLADGAGGSSQQQQQQQQQRPASAAAMHVDDDEDPELAAAIAASLQPAPSLAEQQQQQQQQQGEQQGAAFAAPPEQQQQQEPAKPAVELPELGLEPESGAPTAIEVAVRLPGGGRASRRFDREADTVGHLAAFAAAQGADMARCQLATTFPRRVFGDWGASLAAAGVGHKELVCLEPVQG